MRSTAPPSATDVAGPPAVSRTSTVTAAGAGSAWASATATVSEASSVALPTVPEYAFTVTASSVRSPSLAGGVTFAVNDVVVLSSVLEIWLPDLSASVSSV